MGLESLEFEIVLESRYKITPPAVDIYINQKHVNFGIITKPTVYKFVEQLLPGYHTIEIVKSGKHPDDPEQALLLNKCAIDKINLQRIMFNHSRFVPEYPEPWASEQRNAGVTLEESIVGDTFFGHDGTWQLEFSVPFTDFLLRHMS